MKEIIIFSMYFFSISSIAGMATFLMFNNIKGWGWLVFILFILVTNSLKVK
ncbi:hypothetical protein [Pasteurella multocida]|nr:hypothetical protein [Pasteurella multocida]